MGIDPGTKNYAIVALNARSEPFFARMLKSTVKTMKKDVSPAQRATYRAVIRKLLKHLRADEIIIENFQNRGFGTHLTELVNIMIGSLMSECDHLNIEEYTAQPNTWKSEVNRHANLEELYKYGARHGLPDHMIDALMLATWHRHGCNLASVDWKRVHKTVIMVSRLLPVQSHLDERQIANRLRKKPKKSKRKVMSSEVSPRPKRRGRKSVSAPEVLDVARTRRKRVRGRARR